MSHTVGRFGLGPHSRGCRRPARLPLCGAKGALLRPVLRHEVSWRLFGRFCATLLQLTISPLVSALARVSTLARVSASIFFGRITLAMLTEKRPLTAFFASPSFCPVNSIQACTNIACAMTWSGTPFFVASVRDNCTSSRARKDVASKELEFPAIRQIVLQSYCYLRRLAGPHWVIQFEC